MSKVFEELYSEFYNLLYRDKNYSHEVNYIFDLIKKHSEIEVKSLLELGCGTGNHAKFFIENLNEYYGVDLSSSMIEKFKKNINNEKVNLLVKDITELELKKEFDCILSLFHVASYQSNLISLDRYFKVASNHLKKNGVFVFDFWNGAAVLSDRPFNKLLEVENDVVKVTRFTIPEMNFKDNVVNINFKVWIEDKKTEDVHIVNETHSMRYLFLTEIKMLAEKYNLALKANLNWLSYDELNDKCWYGIVVLQK